MGNDGGSIPKRIDLVKEKAAQKKKDLVTINQNRSKYCAISNDKLQKPLVGCKLGYLYNKEAVLACLAKKNMPAAFAYITRLKDLKEISVTLNSDKNSPYPLICGLSGLEFNGLNKFVFLWSCGCMMSEKVLLTSKTNLQICPVCGKEYKSKDVIQLNASPDEIELKKQLLLESKEKTQKEPKDISQQDAGLGKRAEKKSIESYLLPHTEPTSSTTGLSKLVAKAQDGNILDKLAGAHAQKEGNAEV